MIPFFFFLKDPATTEIYALSLHDALPILGKRSRDVAAVFCVKIFVNDGSRIRCGSPLGCSCRRSRSEEHTCELQSPDHLVCRLLLEKKKYIVVWLDTAKASSLLVV